MLSIDERVFLNLREMYDLLAEVPVRMHVLGRGDEAADQTVQERASIDMVEMICNLAHAALSLALS